MIFPIWSLPIRSHLTLRYSYNDFNEHDAINQVCLDAQVAAVRSFANSPSRAASTANPANSARAGKLNKPFKMLLLLCIPSFNISILPIVSFYVAIGV